MNPWQELFQLQCSDASILLYHLRRAHPELGHEMQKFFSKWQGLPFDPAEMLAELKKRGPVV